MNSYRRLLTMGILLSVSWSAFAYYLYAMEVRNNLDNVHHQALVEARIAYEKDITYRRWSARLGGVYAEISGTLTPNPHLDVPDRDVVTESGKKLTLINPAYMTRMVHTIMEEDAGLKAHITSLNPIRPENAADLWETQALKSFESGVSEVHELAIEDGRQVLRYMHPMLVEKACLKCHATQGYREGEIRGGISVIVPIDRYLESFESSNPKIITRYSVIFASGLAFSIAIITMIIRHERLRNKSEMSLRSSEEKTKESEERFRQLINNAGDAIYLSDLQGSLLRVNYESERQTGYSCEELMRMSIMDMDATHTTPEQLADFVREIAVSRKATFETRHRHKDGHEFPVELRVAYLELGSEAALLGIARDITERKQAEEAMTRSLCEKEILLREIHHRVKNNLQIVSSLLSLQEHKVSSLGMLDVLAESRGRITSMAMIHDQLYHSRDFAEIDMESYLRQFIPRLISTYASKRNISLLLELPSIALPLDQAIPFGLIMNELVTNALKHGFRERIQGTISVSATLNEESVTLLLEDDGEGLPADFTLEKPTSLGLQIITTLAGQLHGTLSIAPASGACFRIQFPARRSKSAQGH